MSTLATPRQATPTTMRIAGKLVTRTHKSVCICGKRVNNWLALSDEPAETPSLFCGLTYNGKYVEKRIGGFCRNCVATFSLMARKPGIEFTKLDRGVHRLVIQDAVELLELGDAIDRRRADVLTEILDASSEAWLPATAFSEHQASKLLEPVVGSLKGQTGPPGSAIPLGSIMVEKTADPYLSRPDVVGRWVDMHAIEPGGLLGSTDTVSEQAAFCPPLANPAEMNLMSINSDTGPVVSRYEYHKPFDREPTYIEICTLLDHESEPTTYVCLSGGGQ